MALLYQANIRSGWPTNDRTICLYVNINRCRQCTPTNFGLFWLDGGVSGSVSSSTSGECISTSSLTGANLIFAAGLAAVSLGPAEIDAYLLGPPNVPLLSASAILNSVAVV